MAGRSGPATSRNSRPAAVRKRPSSRGRAARVSPDIVRLLIGIALMFLGFATLVALVLPGEGKLTDMWRDSIAPWVGAGRRVLPFVLLIFESGKQPRRDLGSVSRAARWCSRCGTGEGPLTAMGTRHRAAALSDLRDGANRRYRRADCHGCAPACRGPHCCGSGASQISRVHGFGSDDRARRPPRAVLRIVVAAGSSK